MIKSNRIRNIFALTILLSPLFSSGAEELESKTEENSSEWDVILDMIFLDGKHKTNVYLKKSQNDLRKIMPNRAINAARILDYDKGKYSDVKEFFKVVGNYHFDYFTKGSLEEKIKDCFKKAANYISIGVPHPNFLYLVLDLNESNLHIANAGERAIVIRNGKIIFNSKDKDPGNLLNPTLHKHSVKKGDMILALTEGFQDSDDFIVKMFLDGGVSSTMLADPKKKAMVVVMKFVKKQGLVRRLRSKSE